MRRRLVLIGANGQLGSDLSTIISSRPDRFDFFGLTHAQVEVSDYVGTRALLVEMKPQIVINTAAYHRVDECEEQAGKAFEVNGLAVRNLASVCSDLDALLVHISTDYVFGGDTSRARPYVESDAPFALNVYGVSKLAGEHFVRASAPRHIVVRSAGLYGVAGSSGKGGNFVELMVRLAREGKAIKVVDDQRTTPTYTGDLAEKIVELIESDAQGLFHVTNLGECSWYEFASAIFEAIDLSPDLQPTTTSQSGAKAVRPSYSVLDNDALRSAGLSDMGPWQDALKEYLRKKGYSP